MLSITIIRSNVKHNHYKFNVKHVFIWSNINQNSQNPTTTVFQNNVRKENKKKQRFLQASFHSLTVLLYLTVGCLLITHTIFRK